MPDGAKGGARDRTANDATGFVPFCANFVPRNFYDYKATVAGTVVRYWKEKGFCQKAWKTSAQKQKPRAAGLIV